MPIAKYMIDDRQDVARYLIQRGCKTGGDQRKITSLQHGLGPATSCWSRHEPGS